MKKLLSLPLLLLLAFSPASAQTTAKPDVSKKVVEYCKKNLNKQVDRGECWDLARFALDYAEADWKSPYNFGTKINHVTDPLKPGDILQFENVSLSWVDGDNTYSMTLPHHTAIVYEVKKDGKIVIAHQNFNNVRKVTTFDISMADIKTGSVQAYRPKAKS